ncbi:unnamed protein product [Strongylus vulgaris]|uniref:Annexin n=1 Tax=Strongylus vulgaris TaxID=40348 RepID=A0A3P7KN17_STRVU|nr:unnamed protein product [Strongylus vulgaris]
MSCAQEALFPTRVNRPKKSLKDVNKFLFSSFDRVQSSMENKYLQLREPYKIKYGKDIISALDKKLGGDLEKTVFALMETPLDYDVKQLKQAIKGLGTDEAVLIEILCSRTPDQLAAIRIAYEKEYKTPLEKDVSCNIQTNLLGIGLARNVIFANSNQSNIFAHLKAPPFLFPLLVMFQIFL